MPKKPAATNEEETNGVVEVDGVVEEMEGIPQPGEQLGGFEGEEQTPPATYVEDVSAEREVPDETAPRTCSFCVVNPAKWKTTSMGASTLFVCDADLVRVSHEQTVPLD